MFIFFSVVIFMQFFFFSVSFLRDFYINNLNRLFCFYMNCVRVYIKIFLNKKIYFYLFIKFIALYLQCTNETSSFFSVSPNSAYLDCF